MTLVAAKCTECGGMVQVDSEKKAAVCESCGAPFIVEDAIQTFNNSFFSTNEIRDSVVNIYGSGDSGFEIKAGVLEKYTGAETNAIIPKNVISIGKCAFARCTGLKSITIPDSVTSIGQEAFEGCTGLTNITIPDSVKSIGEGAFWGCSSLRSIAIPDRVTSIEEGTFKHCTSLKSITIPDSVTSIGKDAFVRCTGLTSITIPDSVTTMGQFAFFKCTGLTSVTIPKRLDSYKNGHDESLTFEDTPYLQRKRRDQGLCIHCGYKLSTFGKCKTCGKPQDS